MIELHLLTTTTYYTNIYGVHIQQTRGKTKEEKKKNWEIDPH